MSPDPLQELAKTEKTTYKMFASSWNTHTDALVIRGGGIHWEALVARGRLDERVDAARRGGVPAVERKGERAMSRRGP